MPEYIYPRLSQPDSIRLLQLLPREEDPKNLRCNLFEYPLRNCDNSSHPYEALSYVWGSETKPRFILIDGQNLGVTENLYTLLLRLQAHNCSRIIWVDAVCINQTNEEEKETQISLMAEIYAKAIRVIVWLGKTEDNSDQALERIRFVGEKLTNSSNAELSHQAIPQLLKRQWFQRIWVLQEVAAARHISIMCGSAEIEGHAFCLGLDSLGTVLKESMLQVTFLMRGALFRSRQIPQDQERLSLDICSLGELVDMYHAYKATKRHDKVYALLGMCSDDLVAGLKPSYELEWKELMCRLVKFILGDQVSVEAWNDKEIAVIKSKGCVLGTVSKVESNINLGGNMQRIEAAFRNTSGGSSSIVRWVLRTSAKSIQKGDVVCLLLGTSKPTIARLREDHLVIIAIVIVPLQTDGGDVQWLELSKSASFTQEFLLVWNWELLSAKMQDIQQYKNLIQMSNGGSPETKLEIRLRKAIRTWNVAQILEDLGENQEAMKTFQEAAKTYDTALGQEQLNTLEVQNVRTILSWAAWRGHEDIVRQLLDTRICDIDSKSKDGRSPLSYAAARGHEATFRLLFDTGKVHIDSMDCDGRTPLSYAAEGGHEAVVRLLVDTGKVDIDSKNYDGRTPLLCAAEGGHEAVVRLLVDTGKVDIDLKYSYNSRTPLSYAAAGGHEAVVRLLVDTGKVNIDSKDYNNRRTPLSYAAAGGHKAVVRLLVDTGKVNIDSKDYNNCRTPLSYAAAGGHEAVVRLLVDTGKVDIDSMDYNGQTPLSYAAAGGHEATIRLLVDTGKVDIDSMDYKNGQTPLSYAAAGGHEATVRLLVNTGKVDIDSKDHNRQTPLSYAAARGYEATIRLLVDTGKVDIDSKDRSGQTPLSYAASRGHEAVVRLLIDTGKVNIDSMDCDGRTPLLCAAEGGYEAIVRLLVDTGKVNIDSKYGYNGQTPLSYAAAGGHEAVVRLLVDTGKVDIDSMDYNGQTPLSYAAAGGHEATVRLLVNTGKVDIDSKGHNGRTPLLYAAEGGHEAILKLLQSSTSAFPV